jgi:hypothetical protein
MCYYNFPNRRENTETALRETCTLHCLRELIVKIQEHMFIMSSTAYLTGVDQKAVQEQSTH